MREIRVDLQFLLALATQYFDLHMSGLDVADGKREFDTGVAARRKRKYLVEPQQSLRNLMFLQTNFCNDNRLTTYCTTVF